MFTVLIEKNSHLNGPLQCCLRVKYSFSDHQNNSGTQPQFVALATCIFRGHNTVIWDRGPLPTPSTFLSFLALCTPFHTLYSIHVQPNHIIYSSRIALTVVPTPIPSFSLNLPLLLLPIKNSHLSQVLVSGFLTSMVGYLSFFHIAFYYK